MSYGFKSIEHFRPLKRSYALSPHLPHLITWYYVTFVKVAVNTSIHQMVNGLDAADTFILSAHKISTLVRFCMKFWIIF